MERIFQQHHTSKAFYVAIVEDRADPLFMGRCRIRVFGLHDEDRVNLPIEDLPWALPLMPINSASITGVGWSPTGIVTGSRVLVTFVDDDFQIPIMMGTLPGFNEENPFGEFENSTTTTQPLDNGIVYDKASDTNKTPIAPPAPGADSVVKNVDGNIPDASTGGSIIASGASMDSVGNVIAAIPAAIANAAQTLPSSISSMLGSLPAAVSGAANSMIAGLQNTFGAGLGGVQGAVQTALGAVSAASTALNAVNSVKNSLANANNLQGALAAAVNIKNTVGSVGGTIGGLMSGGSGSSSYGGAAGTIDPYSAAFKPNGVSAAVSSIGSSSILGSAMGAVNSASGLVGNFNSAQNIIANAKGIGGVTSALINGQNLLNSSLSNIGGLIGSGVSIGPVVTNQISSLKEQFGGDLSGFGDSISSMFGEISTLVDPEVIANKLGEVADYAGSVVDKGVDAAAMLISAGQMKIEEIENDMQRAMVAMEFQKNMCEMDPNELSLMQTNGIDLNKMYNDLGALANKGASALAADNLQSSPFAAISQKVMGATGNISDIMRTATAVTGNSAITGQIQQAISTASSVAGTLQRTVSGL